MMIKILLIYLIIMCWYCYSWVSRNTTIVIRTKKNLLKHFFIVIGFFMFFFVFVRLINLFRETKIFDLKLIFFDNISFIVLGFLLLYSLRRLVFFFFKVHWYKLHCFLLSEENLSTYEIYRFFFFRLLYRPALKSFKYLKLFNAVMFIGLVLVLVSDLYLNNWVLNYTFSYLVYYSLFKIIYICVKFMIVKQNIILDYYNYNMLYPGNIDTKEFWQNYDSDLLEKSRVYKDTIILEIDYFESRFRFLKGTKRYDEMKKLYNTKIVIMSEEVFFDNLIKERNAIEKKIIKNF